MMKGRRSILSVDGCKKIKGLNKPLSHRWRRGRKAEQREQHPWLFHRQLCGALRVLQPQEAAVGVDRLGCEGSAPALL